MIFQHFFARIQGTALFQSHSTENFLFFGGKNFQSQNHAISRNRQVNIKTGTRRGKNFPSILVWRKLKISRLLKSQRHCLTFFSPNCLSITLQLI